MAAANADQSYEIVWLIRRLFRSMAQTADVYLDAIGISVADRAVLEFLHPTHKLSVPEIAARYHVSRQHVQVTVNRLFEKGLIESMPNPRHKRSALLQLTDAGRAVFAGVRHNETEILERLFADISQADVDTTAATLRSLLAETDKE